MKMIYKVMISVLIGLCFIGVGISMNGFEQLTQIDGFVIKNKSEKIDDIEFNGHNLVRKIEMDVHQGNIYFYESNDLDHIKIEAKNIYDGFKIEQDGDQLEIYQPYNWLRSHEDTLINIYVPSNQSLKDIEVNASAGALNIYDMKAQNIKVDNGAGYLEMYGIECYEFDLNGGLSQTQIHQINAMHKIELDLGLGDVDITMKKHHNDYNYDVSVILGNVDIGSHHFAGIANQGMRKDSLVPLTMVDVDCAFGLVNIDMEE